MCHVANNYLMDLTLKKQLNQVFYLTAYIEKNISVPLNSDWLTADGTRTTV
jgi:hypothetical protein